MAIDEIEFVGESPPMVESLLNYQNYGAPGIMESREPWDQRGGVLLRW